jgi:triosephosphate isomerase
VQKLDWTLRTPSTTYGAVEVVVCPPFTDLRTVQTLVEGDRLSLRYGAQDISPARRGRLHR